MRIYGYPEVEKQEITSSIIRHKVYAKLSNAYKHITNDKNFAKADKKLAKIVAQHGAFQIFGDDTFAPMAYKIWDALPSAGESDKVIATTSGRIICANTRLERGKTVFYLEDELPVDANLLIIVIQRLYLLQKQHSSLGAQLVFRYGENWKNEICFQYEEPQEEEYQDEVHFQEDSEITNTFGLVGMRTSAPMGWTIISDTCDGVSVKDSPHVGMGFYMLSKVVEYMEKLHQ